MYTSTVVVGTRSFVPVANLSVFIDDVSAFFKALPASMKLKLVPADAMSFFQKAADLQDATVTEWLVSMEDPEVKNFNVTELDTAKYVDLVDKAYIAKRLTRVLHSKDNAEDEVIE